MIQILDQPRVDTAQFHDRPESDAMLFISSVHQYGFRADGCTWEWAMQQGTRAVRAMGSKMFTEAVQELVTLGYGAVKLEKLLTYLSLKEIAK